MIKNGSMKRVFTVIIIVIAVLGISGISGCKKSWLEQKQDKRQNVPETLNDFQAILDNMITMNSWEPGLGEVAADGYYVTDASWSTAKSPAKNLYAWNNDPPVDNLTNWLGIYIRIFNDNVVLDGLSKFNPATDEEQTTWYNIRGQALYNRAVAFWALQQTFGQPYNSNSAVKDLGIPLRLTSDITERTTRSTVKQVYDQIISDLKLAVDLLPDMPLFRTRGGKAAAYGFLARIFLSMSNYDDAYEYAGKCLKIYNKLLDYNKLSDSLGYVGRLNEEVIFHDVMYTAELSGFLTGKHLVDTVLFYSYHDDDLRKKIFYKVVNGGIGFQGNYNDNAFDLFSGLATDEIYLVRAECSARKGNIDSAMKDLNTLMINRWRDSIPFPEFKAADQKDAIDMVLRERRKELVLRGVRWSDLRRLNREDVYKVKLARRINGTDIELEPNSLKYALPIPKDIIGKTGMLQNPGW